MLHSGDGSGRRYLVERRGLVKLLEGDPPTVTVFADLTGVVLFNASERGIQGVAFHPNYAVNRILYVTYTAVPDGALTLARFQAAADGTTVLPGGVVLLQIPHTAASNHNSMQPLFGPDGYLYMATGDGGGSPGSQDPQSLLGKVLRIDVDNGVPYAIPPSNPFVGNPSVRPEIWAFGLRNPWRNSFDRGGNRDLYIADVGQGAWEEVNRQPAGSAGGQNYGWPIMEGMHCREPAVNCDPMGQLTLPIGEYGHDLGISVTGGYVYRGSTYPIMQGRYIFADFGSGRIWTLHEVSPGVWARVERLDSDLTISSFGEDEAGEVYLTAYQTGRSTSSGRRRPERARPRGREKKSPAARKRRATRLGTLGVGAEGLEPPALRM